MKTEIEEGRLIGIFMAFVLIAIIAIFIHSTIAFSMSLMAVILFGSILMFSTFKQTWGEME